MSNSFPEPSEDQIAQSKGFLAELIAIPSDSTDPSRREACREAADWLVDHLHQIGFEGQVHNTAGHPIVLMHRPGPGRRVLFYAHYDIQPEGDPEEWDSPPFKLEERDEALFGRGASDNKGQMMTFLTAFRLLVEQGLLDCDVTVLIEGEEEIGSPSLRDFLDQNRAALEADVIYVCDTSMWNSTTPAICTRLRGVLSEEVNIRVATHDRHSGQYGGIAPNAAQILSRVLAALQDDEARVTIPEFYEDVVAPPAEELARWQALDFDRAPYEGLPDAGDQERLLNKLWAQPSFEISGISAGYGGEGFKTIIPATATAKVGLRLVEGQDPLRVRAALREFVRTQLPDITDVSFTTHNATPPCVIGTKAPGLQETVAALNAVWPNPTALIGGAGTIPVAAMFQEVLGTAPLLVGFGLTDDGAHGPNEHYALSSYVGGIRSWMRILQSL